ncbi:hypothetical protein BWI93_02260 [Siphonobacter sp. BAB-5385]|uniref:hypothetical protein n=1 Tax=Siphonobacter sp. BAB-5385 TaxID=1864822 RepID=UPI000B9E2B28|nr:hypothetical protein [Siphonobacter sp. BAB-5385]OZI09709.1 hypothetical protein BWI93_02260 [Siphonobacter sp. BAB-5385]
MYLYIFSTTIQTEADQQNLHRFLKNSTLICRWTLDQNDPECVLRLFTRQEQTLEVLQILGKTPFMYNYLDSVYIHS